LEKWLGVCYGGVIGTQENGFRSVGETDREFGYDG
jgi:hypothetical protein